MKKGNTGISTVDIVDGGRESRKGIVNGGEVRGEVDADSEGDEERAAEEEHLVAAEMPSGHPHRHEQHYAGRQDAQLDASHHYSPLYSNQISNF